MSEITGIDAIKYKWYYHCQKHGYTPIFQRANMQLCIKTLEADGVDYITIEFEFVNLETSYAIKILSSAIKSENALFKNFYSDLIKQAEESRNE